MVVALEAFWAVGWAMAALLGYLLVPANENGWRWALAVGIVPTLYAIVVRLGLPESVRFLEGKGRFEEAEASVQVSFQRSLLPEPEVVGALDDRDAFLPDEPFKTGDAAELVVPARDDPDGIIPQGRKGEHAVRRRDEDAWPRSADPLHEAHGDPGAEGVADDDDRSGRIVHRKGSNGPAVSGHGACTGVGYRGHFRARRTHRLARPSARPEAAGDIRPWPSAVLG